MRMSARAHESACEAAVRIVAFLREKKRDFYKKIKALRQKSGGKKNFLKKIKKNEKCGSKQLDLNFVS